ncbi:hypothetical protein ACFLYX_01315 [Chloroflexota bacterium]
MAELNEEPISKAVSIMAGVMFLVEGILAYITGMNIIAAVILILMGIGGLVLSFKHPPGKDGP